MCLCGPRTCDRALGDIRTRVLRGLNALSSHTLFVSRLRQSHGRVLFGKVTCILDALCQCVIVFLFFSFVIGVAGGRDRCRLESKGLLGVCVTCL